jgi:hypothetical protein
MKNCYLARSRAVAARLIGEEMIIMSAADSTLFSQTPLARIVRDRICPEYEVEPEEALRDAEEFVAELAAHGILMIAESPILGSSPITVGTR